MSGFSAIYNALCTTLASDTKIGHDARPDAGHYEQ